MRRKLVLCLMTAAFFCTGCMQSLSIGDYAYALYIGVEEGTSLPYKVTFLVAMPNGSSADSSSISLNTVTAEARTLFEAMETVHAGLPSRLNFSRVSSMVVQEELMQDGRFLSFTDFALGKLDLWLNLRVLVTADPVTDVLNGIITDSDPSLSKLKQNIGVLAERSGITVDVSFSEMMEQFDSKTGDAMLAYCGTAAYRVREDLTGGNSYPYLGGNVLTESLLKTSILGAAVFDGDRMVGVLDGQHTMLVQMVNDRFERGRVLLQLDDGTLLTAYLYRLSAPKIEFSMDGACVSITLEADIEQPEYVPLEKRDAFQAMLEERLETELSHVLKSLQEHNSDAMGFGRYAVRSFDSTAAWEAFDWKAVYRSLPVSFSVNVRLSGNPTVS